MSDERLNVERLTINEKRLKDVNMNSRGLLSPRYFCVHIFVATKKMNDKRKNV